ncbi:MAG: AraC family transcriptional regulator [Eubacteriales bacterium]|nr:AraC family transcriptional regulator [Eubacteriales bacterium]
MTEQILAVQRMQDYISQHLTEDLHPADLARAAMFSPWYAHRLFRETLGVTPAEYIRRLRLAQAAIRLRDGTETVTNVAFDLGFSNPDTFTRAFFREYGANPSQYAKHPVPIPLFVPYGAKYRALRKENMDMSNLQTVFIQVVHKPERLCVIKRGTHAEDYFSYCQEVSCDVWGMLLSMPSLCGEPVCLWLPPKYRPKDTSAYVQGVEAAVDFTGPVPDGFDVIRLPEADYLLFQGQPFREEDYCEAIAAVQQAMDGYDPGSIGYRWDDKNPRIQLEPRGERGYMELRAVKKV